MSAVDVLAAYDRAMSVCNDDITETGEVADVFDELREARAAVADQQSDLELLRNRIRHEANEHQGRIANFDGDGSVEGVVAQQMLTTYAAQLAGFADELEAALARCKGEAA